MKKRTFEQLRNHILESLKGGPKNISQIAKEINADWRTVRRQLIWLEKVEEKVKEIKKNQRARMFKIKK